MLFNSDITAKANYFGPCPSPVIYSLILILYYTLELAHFEGTTQLKELSRQLLEHFNVLEISLSANLK